MSRPDGFWLRVVLHLACALPLLVLVMALVRGQLINPVGSLLDETGSWALRILLISLAITPVRLLTHFSALIRYRRLFGLWAFAYAFSHFSLYLSLEVGFSVTAWLADILVRPFIAMGSIALLLMIPLVITSTAGWQRRLKRRWVLLHKLVFLVAILAVIHYVWQVRGFRFESVAYISILTTLLAVRILYAAKARHKKVHINQGGLNDR
jgi:methionine sulfoxide reductase heme-binding subunit